MTRRERVYPLIHRALARRDRRLANRGESERGWILWHQAAVLRDRLVREYWNAS